jgi:hypothetical protein
VKKAANELRPVYSLGEFAGICRMPAKRLARVLTSGGVTLHPMGEGEERQHRMVVLAEVQEKFPEFFKSLLLMLSVSERDGSDDDQDGDEDEAM